VTPRFTELTRGSTTYKTDWNNIAPTIGVAWRPNVQSGVLRGLLGDPDQATINAGYSVQYDRQGHGVFTGIFGGNPGSTLSVTRNESNGLLAPAGESWPVYLSQTSRLGLAAPCASGVVNAGCNPGSPSFPIPVRSGRADDLSIFDPNIEIGSARSYTIGFERSLSKDTAIDIRYVGTHGVNQWGTENYNERNLLENGFFDEFTLAMGNLQSSIASGCGTAGKPACSFAYRGPGTGTSPLPIYLAYLNGSKSAADAKAYTGSDWTNSTLVGRLLLLNPNVASSAQDLDGNATRRANALKAGLPANFFVLNPDVGDVTVETSHGYSYSNSLQISLRHRLSRGFQIDGNYVYALEKDSTFLGRHYGYALNPSSNVRHAFKFQWSYEVPIGQGHRVGGGLNRALDAIVGGWSFNGVGRIQQPVVNFGSVRLVNMTAADLQREYYTRISDDPNNPGRKLVTMLPDDIILNTRRAFSTAATVSGYSDALGAPDPNGRYIAPAQSADCITLAAGDCAPRTLLIHAPWFTRVDVSLSKRIALHGRTSVDIGFNVLNVFDNINFNTVANPGSGATIFQVSSAYSDLSNTFDPGGRIGEISLRLNW
jgi:hypothetical protein